MSTKQTQTKSKLSEVAKDLKLTNQELADFVSDKLGETKKPSASLNADEVNYILEYFSQNNQVDNFDEYYASKKNKPEPKKETVKPAPEKKKAAKEEAPKKQEKSVRTISQAAKSLA